MRPSRPFLGLVSVAVLTLILTLLFSGGEGARAMLQVSPVSSPTSDVPTLPPPGTEEPGIEPVATLEPPTSVPLPPTTGPTPTPWGFLPAPTIVNPNDLKSLPLAQPAPSGGVDSPEPDVAPTPAPGQSTARAAVALLNYLWLLCGGALLIGGAVAIILIWRRGRST